jgi:hypothetical protein
LVKTDIGENTLKVMKALNRKIPLEVLRIEEEEVKK